MTDTRIKINSCAGCGDDITHAWTPGNWPVILDARPVTLQQGWSGESVLDDEYVLCYLDDPDGPMAVLGVNPNRPTTMPWGTVIPAGATRYRDHLCAAKEVVA